MSNQLTNPLGGRGTSGTITKWTSPTTVGDSILADSGTAITSTGPIRATGTSATAPAFTGSDTDTGIYFPAANQVRISTSGTVALSVDASQNVGIGTTSPIGTLNVQGRVNVGGTALFNSTAVQSQVVGVSSSYYGAWKTAATPGGSVFGCGTNPFEIYAASGTLGSDTYLLRAYVDTSGNFLLNPLTTSAVFNASGTQQGLKLPSSPGNTDPNTLDCYREDSWTPTLSAAATWGGTQPTVGTARYVRIGSTVYCTVVLVGAPNFSSTYLSTTITAPFSASYNAVVPISSGATAFGCAQLNSGATTIFMPTFGVVGAATLSWTFIV